MVQLVTDIGRLEKPTVRGLVAFLGGVVRHVVCRYFSRGIAGSRVGPVVRSLDSTVSELSEAAPLWQFLSQSGTSPPSAAARSEQIAHVLTELGKLKPQHREVITMALFDQRRPSEFAPELGISPAAASMLLLRAIDALRRRLLQPSWSGQDHDHGARRNMTVRPGDELPADVLRELGKLKPRYRKVITMAFFDQCGRDKIAEELGVSREAASMLLFRAINALRQRLIRPPENGQNHDHTAG
jgi:DNA-directed RNA polymerase specialized sigma24 family protein